MVKQLKNCKVTIHSLLDINNKLCFINENDSELARL